MEIHKQLSMKELENEIKNLIITSLNLEDLTVDDIETDAALFGEGLGLDSIDALELGIALQQKYGINFKSEAESTREHFYSVKTMTEFIEKKRDK